jgi:hypothetical protein
MMLQKQLELYVTMADGQIKSMAKWLMRDRLASLYILVLVFPDLSIPFMNQLVFVDR